MASISSVQSSSSAYDVFLSFHGEDTRNNNNNNFTGFLFQALRRKGIVTFKGHTLLKTGEPELLQAIEGSRLFIVVLSKNYASSTRCLCELAHIFNCIETSPRLLLPIFYDVDPSDARKQTGWYEKAFSEHEERFLVDKERMEEVQTWRKALTRVANLSGWYIPNTPQYTVIEEVVEYTITILRPKFSTLQNEAEGTTSDKDEVSYNELSGLMRIRDFISLMLTYPVKLEDEDILRSWISAFPEWKAQLLSTGDDTVMDKPWCVLTEKAMESMKGFMPMEIISKVESGERSIFSNNDVDAIPEAILHQTVDLAVNQLIQTLFSGDYCARYIRLLTRNLAEKRSVVDTIVLAVEDKHTMFGIDKNFLRALWINASTYDTDAEVRVQEEIDMMMEVDDMSLNGMLRTQLIEEKMGSNGQLVIVVDADSNKKLDLQKLRFPTGIVVLITTEPSTQAEKDGDFRIACTMDLNIWTQDHLLPWKVFCGYVGSCSSSSMVRSSMAIQKIAVEIVKECHGHLLAIVLVAKYLTYVQDFKQWELALDKLSILNPSYDYQDSDRIGISRVMVNAFVNIIWEDIDDAQKLCLELSLPVHNIKNGVRDDILVSDWAKIILGYTQELGEYRRQLQYYINELQDRFVLLTYESGDVYLPKETYDIIQSLHTSKPSILRHGALGLTEPPYIGRWHSLIQIELMDNKIGELPQSPDCPKLKVLLLQGNVDLMDIPDSFFNHMPLLQHLDLSYTSIKDLPPSVSKLIQLQKFYLRGCDLFMELPHQIGQLKNLKELDLDGTLITHLPIEIRELINLQSLSLCFDGTSGSTIIPPGLVSNLTQLNYLSINVDPEDERWNENVISLLREICSELKNLQRLSIYLPEADLLKVIPARKSLNFRLVVGQHMRRLISRVPTELETKFKHCDYSIKFVNGVNVPNGVKMHLGHSKALYLDRHMTIKSLSDFDLRNLQGLKVCLLAECNEMETIVSGSNSPDRAASLMLKFLSVFYMKNLRSVCEGSSPFFLCLKSIALHTCPMLTTIFTLDSLKKLSFLEEIIVEDCPKVTTLISHATPEQNLEFFLPKLRTISLLYLPELVNIFNGIYVGPFIEEMIFYYCPRLQSLSKSELSSKSLKIIKGESIWWEALKWNVAEWGDAGRPNYFERIFSPINEEADMMNQLAALQETQLNEYHNSTYQGISSSTQSIAKSSLEIPVLSPLAPVSSVDRGSSNRKTQKQKVVTEPKIFQDASKKFLESARTVSSFRLRDNPLLQMIWLRSRPIPNGCFSNLKSLTVDRCEFLSDVVLPFFLLPFLTNLEQLKVSDCGSVKSIFDVKREITTMGMGAAPIPLPFALKKLTLINLPKLENVWNEDPHGILSMQLLQHVNVKKCKRLTSMFPVSVAKDLEKLVVKDCEELMEIVTEDNKDPRGANRELTFPHPCVRSLKLQCLPKFKYFYYCSLQCDMFETRNEDQVCDEKPTSKLQCLSVGEKGLEMIKRGEFQRNLLHKLQVLTLCFHIGLDVLPYEILQEVPNIEKLVVSNCSFKEIFCCQSPNVDSTGLLLQLKVLRLEFLGKLVSIGSENSSIQPLLGNLETLEVIDCSSLKDLVPCTVSFSNLTYLQVERCDSLLYLFTSSTAKSLTRLKTMEISQCYSIEEIVCKEGDESHENEIIFPQLSCLKLVQLGKLRSFYRGSLLSLPSLEELSVIDCEWMETLCPGTLKADKLLQVKLDESSYAIKLENDLNSTMRQSFLAKLLESAYWESYIDLKDSRLRDIWLRLDSLHIPDLCFSNLHTLTVDGCHFLSDAVLPFYLLPLLPQLESLVVRNCDFVKIIFDVKCLTQDMGPLPFALKKLILERLPNLENVWNAYPKETNLELTFPQLNSLALCDLPKLKYDMLKPFTHLEPHAQNQFCIDKLTPNIEHLTLGEHELKMILSGEFRGNHLNKLKVLGLFFHIECDVFLQRVPNIEKLEVCDGSFKEIFCFDSLNVDEAGLLSQLKVVCSDSLPELVSIGSENSRIVPFLRNLETLEVISCFSSINYLVPCTVSFSNLTFLEVKFCNSTLLYLFTSSTAKSLGQLKTMEIELCDSIEEIVSKEEDESHENEIIFQQLNCLKLDCLPELRRFYKGSLSFPSLKELSVINCDRMETFCAGTVKTDKLLEVKFKWYKGVIPLETDLNSAMQNR